MPRTFCAIAVVTCGLVVVTGQTPPPQQPAPSSGPTELELTIRGDAGAPPHYAIPDFIALTNDKETADAAKLIAEVLWADLDFEREYDMIPRDTYRTIEQTTTTETINFDRWRELGADGVVKGSVRWTGNTFQVEMRLFNIGRRGVAWARRRQRVVEESGAAAHTISDEIHQTQSGLRGVARTKLTFVSDRANERIVDTVEARTGKEVYVSD